MGYTNGEGSNTYLRCHICYINSYVLPNQTALGQASGELVFQNFWYSDLCMKLRASSFRSFITAIQTFRGAFALSVFLKTDGRHRYVATSVAIFIMVMSGIQLNQMVNLASVTIFHQSL